MISTATATVAFDFYTDKFAQNFSNNDSHVPFECNQEINTNSLSDFIVYGVFVNLIGLFGIVGNAISMIILSRPQMKSSINYLLIGLARCDTVLLIISVSFFSFLVPFPRTRNESSALSAFCLCLCLCQREKKAEMDSVFVRQLRKDRDKKQKGSNISAIQTEIRSTYNFIECRANITSVENNN